MCVRVFWGVCHSTQEEETEEGEDERGERGGNKENRKRKRLCLCLCGRGGSRANIIHLLGPSSFNPCGCFLTDFLSHCTKTYVIYKDLLFSAQ